MRWLALWLETETAAQPQGDMMPIQRAVQALQHGQITDALSTQGIEGDVGWLRILAAASVGASVEEVAAGLSEPLYGNGEAILWAAYGLLLREGADTAAARATLLAVGRPETGTVLDAFASLRTDPDALDAVLHTSDPTLRGAARAAAVIVLGEEAPEVWREEARRLQLPFERPYFGEQGAQ
ncbi:MAG: hypothetical protein ACI8RZ_001611 [Myxococcota bacterium]|jgi:hypothetical protein